MELEQISEYCYFTTPVDFKHRPALGYILCPTFSGEMTAIMVDAGNSQEHMNEFLKVISSNNLPLPDTCLITHSHWDHMLGMQAFAQASTSSLQLQVEKDSPIEFYLSGASFSESQSNVELYKKALFLKGSSSPFNTLKECNLSSEEKNAIKLMECEYGKNFDPIRDVVPNYDIPSIVFDSMFCYDLDIDFLEIPTPHCKNHSIVFVAEDKVIYGGDCLCSNPNVDDSSDLVAKQELIISYIKLRNALSSLDFQYFVSSHRGILTSNEVFGIISEKIDHILSTMHDPRKISSIS